MACQAGAEEATHRCWSSWDTPSVTQSRQASCQPARGQPTGESHVRDSPAAPALWCDFQPGHQAWTEAGVQGTQPRGRTPGKNHPAEPSLQIHEQKHRQLFLNK